MKTALAVLLALTPVSALADVNDRSFQSGYSASRTCFKTEYREEYVPGDLDNPGYVKSWNETLEVPCNGDTAAPRPPPSNPPAILPSEQSLVSS